MSDTETPAAPPRITPPDGYEFETKSGSKVWIGRSAKYEGQFFVRFTDDMGEQTRIRMSCEAMKYLAFGYKALTGPGATVEGDSYVVPLNWRERL